MLKAVNVVSFGELPVVLVLVGIIKGREFTPLKTIVDFDNPRDVLPVCDAEGVPGIDCWPAPEVAGNAATYYPMVGCGTAPRARGAGG